MYLLDTDHITLLDRGGEEGERRRVRLASIPTEEVVASVVSYEEQIGGGLPTLPNYGWWSARSRRINGSHRCLSSTVRRRCCLLMSTP